MYSLNAAVCASAYNVCDFCQWTWWKNINIFPIINFKNGWNSIDAFPAADKTKTPHTQRIKNVIMTVELEIEIDHLRLYAFRNAAKLSWCSFIWTFFNAHTRILIFDRGILSRKILLYNFSEQLVLYQTNLTVNLNDYIMQIFRIPLSLHGGNRLFCALWTVCKWMFWISV